MMESDNIDLRNLSKLPEKEFKKHFRDWMEQDDVARSLQAKLRKDLIASFNKTTLGKKIIAQTAVFQRMTLSPLILALNTLVGEFLYALNCHFTLSVFCTEVPYRNTLPDFESTRHFRFSEHEIFEIIEALSTNWEKQKKDEICKEYSKEKSNSLLFIVLRYLLSKPQEKEKGILEERPPEVVSESAPQKPQKVDYQSNNNFRYLNKYLIILSKKVKEMSQHLELLQSQRNAPQPGRKSLQTRKFENLNRSLEKISENLRQMSVSKRKNKRLATVVTAVDTMAKQFERCATNFDQISRGLLSGGGTNAAAATQKSYNDWIKEMRTTVNGKKFLDKIESCLRKTLHRERENMKHELEQRVQIQKDIIKTKYKQKLTEELAKYTSRGNADATQKTNDSFEKKLKEFEAKHQELHQRIHEAEKRVTEAPIPIVESIIKHPDIQIDSKGTQTASDTKPTEIKNPANTQDRLQQMVKTISDQERQIDHIVFDAKLRIQELEHESNQLDRSFREYLERQRAEKQKMCESATSIWQSYALGKSMLNKKCAAFRSTARTMEKHPVLDIPAVIFDVTTQNTPALSIPIINIDTSASANSPAFENPFRIAKRKVLARSKTLPPPAPSTDTESSTEKYTQYQRQQRPSVCRLIEHNYNDGSHTKLAQKPPLSPSSVPAKVVAVTQLSPELNIKDITLDSIEICPTAAKSSSLRSGYSNGSSSSPRGVFKLRRQLFTTTDNGGPSSSNVQKMNSNSYGNKEAEEPLKQINKENGDDGKKSIDRDKKDVLVESKAMKGENRKEEQRTSEVRFEGPRGDNLDVPLTGMEKNSSSQSFRLDISTGRATSEKESDNDFWA